MLVFPNIMEGLMAGVLLVKLIQTSKYFVLMVDHCKIKGG